MGWRRTSSTAAVEFGEFVEEEHAVVRQADFARARDAAAADQPGAADGVVRRAEGAVAHEAAAVGEHAGDGVDFGDVQRLLQRERREHGGQAAGDERFAAAGRADHQHVVPAGGRHLQRALHVLLAFHFGHVHVEFELFRATSSHAAGVRLARAGSRKISAVSASDSTG